MICLTKSHNDTIKEIKMKAKWGCLIWGILLIIIPILLFLGYFTFHMVMKERTLLISDSPNKVNTIRIVEKGEPAFFGPSSVRIKHRWDYIDGTISNDGKKLNESNTTVIWEDDAKATIILDGEEQQPEFILFDAKKSKPFKEGNSAPEKTETELGSFTFKTSESPNLLHIIEFREVLTTTGRSTVRIYYGKRGSILEKYKQHLPTNMYTPENFQVIWISDDEAVIEVTRQDEEGHAYSEETIEINIVE